jgi:glycosyltransferase involved in cell wall biosynthesis
MTSRDPGARDVELSVVIPAYDAADVLAQQLEALVTQNWGGSWEIVVVDNNSRDRTAAVVRRYSERHSRLRLVCANDGQGAGFARNVGARSASGDSLAFCDADDVVAPDWVASMGEALRRHEFVTGPLELAELNPAWLVESRGRSFAEERAMFEGIFPFATSCNLGLRRSVFERIGGFDESYRIGEDLGLSLRLWLVGVSLHFDPRIFVHYRYRPTLRATYRQARAYGRVRPVIGERLREAGRAAPKRGAGLRNWAWLARHLPLLTGAAGRARWLWVAGQRIGNLEGSLRVRRLYL